MPFWFTLLMFAASTILGQLFRPKTSKPKPATLADIEAPTAESTRSVPKLYGTALLKAPNVVSLTDFSSEAIKSKVSTLQKIMSFGMAKSQTIGFKYFCGIEMALAYRVDALTKIIIGDKVAWEGEVTTDSEIYINKPSLFGGSDPATGGNGGVVAYVGVHMGLPNATKDAYLVSQYGNYSAHRGIFYTVCKGQKRAKGSGYLGNSENIAAWQYVARCIPNNLPYGTYGYTNKSNINSGDANPAEVLYDIFRSAEYAIGMPQQDIDLASFTYAATLYYEDNLGFSGLWDTSKPCRDIINQILQLTDSVIYSDLQTGKLVIKAARADYDVADIPSYTDKEILSIVSYTRGAWSETTNYLTVPFVNRLDNFIQDSALAFDTANQRIQTATIASNVQHIGISNPDTAADIAQRDLKAMTTPLAKIVFHINLKGYQTNIGSTFKLTTKRIKDHNGNHLVNVVFRCTGVKIGTPKNPVIEIEAVEDIFNSTSSIVAAPPGTNGTDPSVAPVATSTYAVDELPYMLAGDETAHLWVMAKAPNTGSFSFDLFSSADDIEYISDDPNNDFTPTGLLNAAYDSSTAAIDNSGVLVINSTGATGLDRLEVATAAQVANGKNLFIVIEGSKSEIMAFESYTLVSGNYQLNNVWRGLFDTTPQSFTSAARAWFFSYGDARGAENFTTGSTAYAKILTRTLQGMLDLADAAAISRTMGVRTVRPYVPGNIRINGVYNGTIPVSGDITVAWSHRDRTRQGNVLAQNGATVGLEGGASYTLKIYNQAGTLLRTVANLVTESYLYTNVQETADNGSLANALTFMLYSTRDGVTSLQAQIRGSARSGSTIYVPTFVPSGVYVAPPAGNSTSIGGVPITGTPTGTNNTPIYDPVTGTIIWQPGGIADLIPNPAGVYGSTTKVPQVTIDAKGRVTTVTELTIAAGSSGGTANGDVYSLDAPPATGLSSQSDYFAGSSLNSKWSVFQPGYSTLTVVDGAVKFIMPTQATDRANGILQTLPAGDCTIITKLYFPVHRTNFSVASLALFADAVANPNTSAIVELDVINFTTGTNVEFRKLTNWTTFSSNFTSASVAPSTQNPIYLRLVRSGTTWYAYYCTNPSSEYNWTLLTSQSQAAMGFAPAQFGLLINNIIQPTTVTARFDFVYYSATAYANLPGGVLAAGSELSTILAAPKTTTLQDEEFEGAALDTTRWVKTGSAAIESYNDKVRSGYFARFNNGQSIQLAQNYVPGAVDFSVTLCASHELIEDYTLSSLGISNAAGTDSITNYFIYETSPRVITHKVVAGVTTYSVYTSSISSVNYPMIFLHIQRVAGVWGLYFSNNGIQWTALATAHAQTITVGKILLGFGGGSVTTKKTSGVLHWLRRDWITL